MRKFLFQRLRAFKLIPRRIPPGWLFRCAQLSVFLAVPFSRHDRKMMTFLTQALKEGGIPCSKKTARNHLVYRKWRNSLVYGWPGWKERWKDLVKLEGEEHLRQALTRQKGVILLSVHRFGYEVLVAPVLSLSGYKLHRTGQGDVSHRIKRWGEGDELAWKHIRYGDDGWSRLRALKQMQRALLKNEVVHVSIQTHRSGPAAYQIEPFGKRYSLDPHMFKLIETLQAPVLPCFSFPDDRGKVWIKMHAPLRPLTREVMGSFGSLYTRYIREFPEVSRVWRRLQREWDAW